MKTIKFLAALVLFMAAGMTNANAAVDFLGHSAIDFNGTWYYAGTNHSWCTGGAFNGANLGVVNGSISLGGQSQTWENGNVNWNSGVVTMGYRIDDGADQSIELHYYKFENNNNFFQSGGADFATSTIDISGLAFGHHTLAVWFNCGDAWDSNNSANYVASFTVLSIDTDYQPTDDGYYYINMPTDNQSNMTTIDMTGFTRPFKVYDAGGKDGNYPYDRYGGYLILKAPEGYVIQVTGSVQLIKGSSYVDYLSFINGDPSTWNNGNPWNKPADRLAQFVEPTASGNTIDIGAVTSADRGICLVLIAANDRSNGRTAGLDLTVNFISTSESHSISVGSATGGSATASPTSAAVNTPVTISATPDAGYLPNDFTAVDANGHSVPVTGGWYSGNEATLTMGASDVTVTPHFTNVLSADDGGLYVNTPYYNTPSTPKVVNIPAGVTSFKIYDYGGKDGKVQQQSNGYLLLKAPDGFLFEISGTSNLATNDIVNIYDGATNSSSSRLGYAAGPNGNLGLLESTGNQMLVYLWIQNTQGNAYDGIDLTVNVIDPQAQAFDITIESAANGSLSTTTTTGLHMNDDITLTVTPNPGYMLNGLTIQRTVGSDVYDVQFAGGLWYSGNPNEATFKMPLGNVTVTPVFAKTTELTANMVKGSQEIHIPNGVSSFKLYDDGGPGGDYSKSFTGTTEITAPCGYILRVSGTATVTNSSSNYIYIMDTTGYPKTIQENYYGNDDTPLTIGPIVSPEKWFAVEFRTGTAGTRPGFELTFEILPISELTETLYNKEATNLGAKVYWTTFYHADQAYELSAYAQAFTLTSDGALHLVGIDGKVVPAGCPVIVKCLKESVTYTATTRTAEPYPGNVLKGTTANLKVKDVYVLNAKNGVLGFYKFTGTLGSVTPGSTGKAYLESNL